MTHVRIHPGETVPTHTHPDEDQVYYVVTGTGFVVLDGERTDVAAGSSVLIPIGHRARDHEHRLRAARLRVLRRLHPGARMTELVRDRLRTVVLPDRAAMGAAAAASRGATACADSLPSSRRVRVIFAAAASQAEFLAALAERDGIDWSRVDAFHLDEYVGLPPATSDRSGLARAATSGRSSNPVAIGTARRRRSRWPGGRGGPLRRAPRRRRHRPRPHRRSARTVTSRSTTRTSPTSTTRSW